jgi:hypothetical protein
MICACICVGAGLHTLHSLNIQNTQQEKPEIHTTSFSEKHPVADNTSVNIDNISGSVIVHPSQDNSIHMTVTKKGTSQEHKATSCITSYDCHLKRFCIKTTAQSHPCNVTYDVYIPLSSTCSITQQSGSVSASSIQKKIDITLNSGSISANNTTGGITTLQSNGSLDLCNIHGSVTIRNNNGSVTLCQKELSHTDSIHINQKNGSTQLYLDTNIHADITAETTNGSISSSAPIKTETKYKKGYTGQVFNGYIGSKKHTISLESINGSISLSTY